MASTVDLFSKIVFSVIVIGRTRTWQAQARSVEKADANLVKDVARIVRTLEVLDDRLLKRFHTLKYTGDSSLRLLRRFAPEIDNLSVGSATRSLHRYLPSYSDGVELKEGLDALFITSNGAGLGHLTRSLAVAEQLPKTVKVAILTLSEAYPQVARFGYPIFYYPSQGKLRQRPEIWNTHFQGFLMSLVLELDPRVIVFDGTYVYDPVSSVARRLGRHLIWMQRGCWKDDVDANSRQRHNASDYVDSIIIPGEYGIDEVVDSGSEIEVNYTQPVILANRSTQLSRIEACSELQLDPTLKYILINLGGGPLGIKGKIVDQVVNRLRERAETAWRAVLVQSPLATGGSLRDTDFTRVIEAYPISKYLKAFEFSINAAGYNAVNENIALGLPSIIIPNPDTLTDDQVRRARGVSDRNLAYMAQSFEEFNDVLDIIMDEDARGSLVKTLNRIAEPRGDSEAATVIVARLEDPHIQTRGDFRHESRSV